MKNPGMAERVHWVMYVTKKAKIGWKLRHSSIAHNVLNRRQLYAKQYKMERQPIRGCVLSLSCANALVQLKAAQELPISGAVPARALFDTSSSEARGAEAAFNASKLKYPHRCTYGAFRRARHRAGSRAATRYALDPIRLPPMGTSLASALQLHVADAYISIRTPTSSHPNPLPTTTPHKHLPIYLKLYNVNLTGSFAGLYPSTISVDAAHHAHAVRLYKKALSATVVRAGAHTVLESRHGFRFRVDARSGRTKGSAVRLALPSGAARGSIARALAGGGRVSHNRSGIVVLDAYGISWTLA